MPLFSSFQPSSCQTQILFVSFSFLIKFFGNVYLYLCLYVSPVISEKLNGLFFQYNFKILYDPLNQFTSSKEKTRNRWKNKHFHVEIKFKCTYLLLFCTGMCCMDHLGKGCFTLLTDKD